MSHCPFILNQQFFVQNKDRQTFHFREYFCVKRIFDEHSRNTGQEINPVWRATELNHLFGNGEIGFCEISFFKPKSCRSETNLAAFSRDGRTRRSRSPV